MSHISEFNTTNLKTLRIDIDAALATVAKLHGITLKIGNMRFSGTEFRTQLTAATLTPAGDKAPSIQEFDGIKVGDTFMNGGRNFVVSDFMLNRPKFPVIAKCKEDGRLYKFTMSVKYMIKAAQAH